MANPDPVLKEWSETAPYWDKHAATFRTIFTPLTTALIEAAGITAGRNVLDIAAGAGEPSLTIAEIVGPTGSVTCTDAIADMVRAAEREAARRRLTNVTFRRCEAEALPFTDNTFDAVVCRLGVMFFPDPLSGMREMLRVAKPGGALALAVWDKSDCNPFLNVITNALSRYVETAPEEPDAPGAFRFAEHGKLAQVLRDAKASEVTERILKFEIAAPITFEQFWELRSEASASLREKLQRFLPDELRQLIDEVRDASREFFTGGYMRFPAQMIVVDGRKHRSANKSSG